MCQQGRYTESGSQADLPFFTHWNVPFNALLRLNLGNRSWDVGIEVGVEQPQVLLGGAQVWEKREVLESLAEGPLGQGFGKEDDSGVDIETEEAGVL